MKKNQLKQAGFTLIEIALVLVIVGLLLGGILTSLSTQLELRQINSAKKQLNEAKHALIGYAMSHAAFSDGKPYLPCPDTDGDGLENRVGAACAGLEGDLPWADLGVAKLDSWNRIYRYRVTQAFANSNTGIKLITPSSVGDITVRDAAGGAILASNVPMVIYSRGQNGAELGADEAENTSLNAVFVSHENSKLAGSEFDDIVDWLPSFILFQELVSAGQLP